MDIMTDNLRSNIWIVDVSGGNHRALLSGADNYSSPRWSPSGDRIAYVTSAEGRGPEIHVCWVDTGQTAMLTNLTKSPSSINWSPDGKWIAFSMLVSAKAMTLTEPPERPEGAQWAAPVDVTDRLYYRTDGYGYFSLPNTHIFLVPADGGTPRQLTSGDYNHDGPLSWSPDSERIVFSANRVDDYEYHSMQSEVWTVDVDNGELTRLTDRLGPDAAPTFSPDGEKIAFLGYDDRKMSYENSHVYVMDADGDNVKDVTPEFDRSIGYVRWAGNANRLYIQYDDNAGTRLAQLSLRGDIEPLARDVGGMYLGRPYTGGSFSVADDGAYAYTAAGTPYRPADVAAARRGGQPRKLTALNDDLLARMELGEVEEITWESSADRLNIEGWIVKPPDFDPAIQYPLILEVHGGPYSAYGPYFSAEIQLYAAAGYVVLYGNPRGSTSYGYDFANATHHSYPGKDFDDLMSGVDAVIERGYVDAHQLFVTGGSGGGLLTAWIVGKTDRFAAAAVVKPGINWISLVLTSDRLMMPEYWFDGPPWEDFEDYWSRSPLSLVGNVTTPTALLIGEEDHHTPISEAEQFYQALKLRKIDTVLVRFPGAPHTIADRPSRLIAKVDNILGWFGRYRTN
jgi:dipeptidyl aminopeptidase/acylaminoacyl peptidase